MKFFKAALVCVLACASASGYAQKPGSFPDRPVRLLVSVSPGGSFDLTARALAQGLGEQWGQQVVVENRTGASGLIAAEMLVKSPPDGYLLSLMGDTTLVITPFLQENMPYDTLTDLTPVAMVGNTPLMLIANTTLKVRTVQDLVSAARARPGSIDYGSAGVGSTHHISMEVLQRAAGVRLNHIPYKGAAPALQDLIAGRIPVMFVAVATALPYIKDRKLTVLGIGTPARAPMLPDVPTIAESGFPKFESATWIGIMGPRGMPAPLVDKISADIEKVTRSAAYRDVLVPRGIEPRSSTPRELAEYIRVEYERNRVLIKSAGIKAE
jgi:tripartite-type tricarboxylate transporter receptor subunit TctC